MKHPLKTFTAGLMLCILSTAAHATDTAECELLLVQVLQVEGAEAEAQIASYRPATKFIKSVQDDIPGHITQVEGQDIRAIMCTRNEVIPTQSDYTVMSTGIPFILSQDFDSPDTDSLTMYWKDGKIEHVYKGYPLSEEAQAILDTRLTEFSDRGLSASAHEAADVAAKIKEKTKLRDEKARMQDTSAAPAEEEADVISTSSSPRTLSGTPPIQTEIEIVE